MHWLDSTPSREIDPVLDCLAFLARQADRPSSPVLLRAGLALSDTGTLPFHQIEPALDQVGMRGEPMVRRLRGWPLQKLPAINWLTVTGHVNGGLRAAVRAEAKDDAAAKNLRDVLQGILALAKLQTGQNTEFAALTNSIELGGDGNTVSLGLSVPMELVDKLIALRAAAAALQPPAPPAPPAAPEAPEPPPVTAP